jgi:hypothetical protein
MAVNLCKLSNLGLASVTHRVVGRWLWASGPVAGKNCPRACNIFCTSQRSDGCISRHAPDARSYSLDPSNLRLWLLRSRARPCCEYYTRQAPKLVLQILSIHIAITLQSHQRVTPSAQSEVVRAPGGVVRASVSSNSPHLEHTS